MKTSKKLSLGALFLAVAAPIGYEASQLNDLVWSAPNKGEIESFRGGKIINYVMELERNGNWHEREDLAHNLNTYFNEGSPVPSQVCIDIRYARAGVYMTNPDSPLLWKYIEENPVFKDFTLENFGGEPTLEINNHESIYTHKDCSDSVSKKYLDELQAIINFRHRQLNP